MKYILITILFGIVAPLSWTVLVSNLYAVYVPDSPISFWFMGAVYSFISSLIIAGPLGALLPKMKYLLWLVFCVGFFFSSTAGMYIYGGLHNFVALWSSPTTWFFIFGSLVAMSLGFNIKCLLTR